MKYKNKAEIEALILNDVIVEVMSRLVDISSVPIGVAFYEFTNDAGSYYDRIVLHESIEVKPSLEEVEAEFVVYKQELLDAFDPYMAAKVRVDALPEIRDLIHRRGIPNAELEVKRILKENDSALLDQLEVEHAAYLPEKALADELRDDIRLGKFAKDVCDECLHVVRGHNKKANLTKNEIRQMKTAFADILEDLQDGMPVEAKVGIEGVTDPAYASLKAKLLKVFSNRGV